MSQPAPPPSADRSRYELGQLVATSRAMASERDIGKLLALILESCRHVTGADAGSVYVVEDNPARTDGGKRLRVMLSQNDSIAINFREFTAQAGVSLEKALLYDEIRQMFDGFVDASVQAIEQRDPTTAGHSRRVATLSIELAKRVDAIGDGPLAEVRFDDTRLQQIEYAAVLHDFGKVGVRERVLVKPRKLYDEDRRAIEMRFAYIKKALQVDHAERKLRVALQPATGDVPGRLAEIDAQLARKLAEVDEAWAFIDRANEPALLDDGGFDRLVAIAGMTYLAGDGEPRPYLESDELAALQIRRGSLTAVERVEIESHVVHTYKFLNSIPWGKRYADVPRIAGAHHEYLNGSGYPGRLGGAAIPIESRIMTIADIFDALTASDRPYKRAVPVARALAILDGEVSAGKCDPALFRVFVEAEVYKKVL